MSFFNGVNPQSVSQAPDGFTQFKLGDNKARISNVIERQSQKGDPMLEITFTNEEGATIRYYIVEGEYKLPKLKQLCIAFNIPFECANNTQSWIYKWGVVVCKEGKPYNGNTRPEVSYVRPIESRKELQPRQPMPSSQPQGHPYSQPQQQQSYHQSAGQAPKEDDEFLDDIPF